MKHKHINLKDLQPLSDSETNNIHGGSEFSETFFTMMGAAAGALWGWVEKLGETEQKLNVRGSTLPRM